MHSSFTRHLFLLFLFPMANQFNVQNKLPCHAHVQGDLLPSIEDFQPDVNSIYFHETSCNGDLNARQACTIEAAALAHKKRQVFVLFSGPVNHLAKLRQVNLIRNVHCARLHLNFIKQINEEVLFKVYFTSEYPIVHIADFLRYETLYKWGGTYLDLDMVVTKPLKKLGRNWVTAEKDDFLSVGALDFTTDATARKVIEMVFEEINNDYNATSFNHNGNGALNRVFKRLCQYNNVTSLKNRKCNGFKIYSRKFFYPVPFRSEIRYFKAGHRLKPHETRQAYAYHMWNTVSKGVPIEDGSIYARLAKTYCPKTYLVYGRDFGRKTKIKSVSKSKGR